jgi:hypothetical protein
MLDPTGSGEDLFVLPLIGGDHPTIVVEDNETSRRRPLIKGTDEISHQGTLGAGRVGFEECRLLLGACRVVKPQLDHIGG